MAHRIPLLRYLWTPNAPSISSNAALPLRPFSSSTSSHASTVAQRRKHRDPYALAQARARKAANLSRQQVLKKERAAALGDPVRGIPTPFVESFDTAEPLEGEHVSKAVRRSPLPGIESDPEPEQDDGSAAHYLNHSLRQEEITRQLFASKEILCPVPPLKLEEETDQQHQDRIVAQIRDHENNHRNVTEAVRRIVSLDNSNAKSRLKVNIKRCIQTFGRHVTDKFLPPKALSVPIGTSPDPAEAPAEAPQNQVIKRAGVDTGSSEVQIAILTAKIRGLANFLETRGRKDKVGKRDLRLLVHRRQKLLKYLHRKERGGPRWQRCIEKLGLTDGTWRGEISL